MSRISRKGDWKPKAQKKTEPRTAKIALAKALLRGDEIRLSTKGPVGQVTEITRAGELLTIQTDVLGERTFHEDHQVIRLDPKPPTKSDQRRPR